MKKYILFFISIFTLIFILACQRGDKGITGAQGDAGSSGEGYLVMQFQDGVLPGTTYAGTSDTRIASHASSSLNYGSCSNIEFGYDVSKIWRVLIKFDASAINVSATVKSAYLTLYCANASGSVDAAVYKVTKNWTEGTGNCGGVADVNASWNYYNGSSNPWVTPGGDYDISTQSEIKTVTTTGYYTIKLNTAMVQEWIQNPSQNYGMLIKSLNETAGYLANRDKTESDPAKRPKLTIYYTLP